MNFTADPNLLIMAGLVFLLGLIIGIFLTAGGRRKWKERYTAEVDRRKELERSRDEREKHYAAQEKEWRERDSLRGSAVRDDRGPRSRDLDGDGVRDEADRRPTDDRRA
jgi:hypothetical protein